MKNSYACFPAQICPGDNWNWRGPAAYTGPVAFIGVCRLFAGLFGNSAMRSQEISPVRSHQEKFLLVPTQGSSHQVPTHAHAHAFLHTMHMCFRTSVPVSYVPNANVGPGIRINCPRAGL